LDIAESETHLEDLREGFHYTRLFVAEDLNRVNKCNLGLWSVAKRFENWSIFLLVHTLVNVISDK